MTAMTGMSVMRACVPSCVSSRPCQPCHACQPYPALVLNRPPSLRISDLTLRPRARLVPVSFSYHDEQAQRLSLNGSALRFGFALSSPSSSSSASAVPPSSVRRRAAPLVCGL
jgi:hypothetical protein